MTSVGFLEFFCWMDWMETKRLALEKLLHVFFGGEEFETTCLRKVAKKMDFLNLFDLKNRDFPEMKSPKQHLQKMWILNGTSTFKNPPSTFKTPPPLYFSVVTEDINFSW